MCAGGSRKVEDSDSVNKFDESSLTPELTFSDQNKIDLKFSTSDFVWNLCFLDLEHAPY